MDKMSAISGSSSSIGLVASSLPGHVDEIDTTESIVKIEIELLNAEVIEIESVEAIVQLLNGFTPYFRIYSHVKCMEHLSVIKKLADKPVRLANTKDHMEKIFDKESLYTGELATKEEILTFHTQEYLEHINLHHKQLKHEKEVGFGLKCHDIGTLGPSFMDIHSYDAALAAVGTAMKAVKDCLDVTIIPAQDRHKYTAFAMVRPPGHHAFPSETHGMCIFNNIAITALYLVEKGYRVAVLDFDTHHGDGIAVGLKNNEDVFIGGTYENDQAPALNDDPLDDEDIVNNSKFSLKPLSRNCERNEFHWNWEIIMQDLSSWVKEKKTSDSLPDKPLFVLAAAGFDGHINEKIAFCRLDYDDYGIITRRILTFCQEFQSPFVPVLEGGYEAKELPLGVEAHTREMSHYSNTGNISAPVPEFFFTPPVPAAPMPTKADSARKIEEEKVMKREAPKKRHRCQGGERRSRRA